MSDFFLGLLATLATTALLQISWNIICIRGLFEDIRDIWDKEDSK